ncbi:uncharacterized protein LOC132554756 [Ylistrum balloti]|uniref:uncharacterized protein LOC132554756 n=1 Tax=Ylistrum balloti TaxID=509963 RepID=UPI0029059AF8|nr:uncharacterized protein LOC132554756 [Ylistrum balloti]
MTSTLNITHYISGDWMFIFDEKLETTFTPDCYYEDHGVDTMGSCSDDVTDVVFQNSSLRMCQSLCDVSPGCQGVTFQKNHLLTCHLHNCSDSYISQNNTETSFHAKRCEPYNQFVTAGPRTRATCSFWRTRYFIYTDTHLNCQIACIRKRGCQGVTVRPTSRGWCYLHSCHESATFNDENISFYSKNSTGLFNGHGSSRVGRCSPTETKNSLSNTECAERCLNKADCQGYTTISKRLRCTLHSCGNYMNMTNYSEFTFYSKTPQITNISALNNSAPERRIETPIQENNYTWPDVTCDFQPTTNVSEICSNTEEEALLVSDKSECFHSCETTEGCEGVTTRTANMTCYLQHCSKPMFSLNNNLRFLSKQVARNCTYIGKGLKSRIACAFIPTDPPSSLAHCQEMCTQNSVCRGIEYDESTMPATCKLSICSEYKYKKTSTTTTTFYSNSCEDVSYYEDAGNQTIGNCGSFEAFQVNSEDDCKSLCSASDHCLGVTITSHRLECWKYSCLTTSHSYITNDTSSYLKVCSSISDEITPPAYSTSESPLTSAELYTPVIRPSFTTPAPTSFETTQMYDISTIPDSSVLLTSSMTSVATTNEDMYLTNYRTLTETASFHDTDISLRTHYISWSLQTDTKSSLYSVVYMQSNSAYELSTSDENLSSSTTLSSNTVIQNITVLNGEFCSCVCHLQNKTLHLRIQELLSLTKLDRYKLTKYSRKLECAEDGRTSSTYIGVVGVVFIVSIGFVIVLSDVVSIGFQLYQVNRHAVK